MSNDIAIAGGKFLQLHILTTHLPSNLNRDNLGRPKTAQYGNTNRGRIASQAIKYAWKHSDIFRKEFDGRLSIPTRKMWEHVYKALVYNVKLEDILEPDFKLPEEKKGIDEGLALAWTLLLRGDKENKDDEMSAEEGNLETQTVEEQKGKGKRKKNAKETKKPTEADLTEKTVTAFTPDEIKRLGKTITALLKRKTPPTQNEIGGWRLRNDTSAVDIALFGRMLASAPEHQCDGAVQLSHLITVNPALVEDDYFTAVDELNKAEDLGAGHVNVAQFLSGLYYCHVVIDLHQLVNNLGEGDEKVNKAVSGEVIKVFIKAATTISPRGKQHPMSSEGSAVYLRAEIGNQCPRHLGLAFLKPIRSEDLFAKTIERIGQTVSNIDRVYGKAYDDFREMNVEDSKSHDLNDIINFATQAVGAH